MSNYKSGYERTLAVQLEKAGVRFKYEGMKIDYVIAHQYAPDFCLENGVIIEAKGLLDQLTRSKMVAVKKARPDLDIRFVFQRGENKINKKSKVTYMDWAEKNGFPAADGPIPKEWLV